MRYALITIIASLVASPSAFADVDPDQTFSGVPPLAYNSGSLCLGNDCPMPISGAVHPADCNLAGLSTPAPFMPYSGYSLDDGQGLQLFSDGFGGSQFRMPRTFGLTPPIDSSVLDPASLSTPRVWDEGYDASPIRGTFDGNGFGALPDGIYGDNPASVFGVPAVDYGSINLTTALAQLGESLGAHAVSEFAIGNTDYVSLMLANDEMAATIQALNASGIRNVETNICRQVLLPVDPNFGRTGRHGGGSWGQKEDDQWAIKRVGFTNDEKSAWSELPDRLEPVVVAVIDTGLDWHHKDIARESLWTNDREVPGNGIDDDRNGYVDDIVGWDFLANSNSPWDYDGHGTVVAGVIAAEQNDIGIAGISHNAKIMVLKAVNDFGTTRASFLAEAIVYAVDNGAQIINISVGGVGSSLVESAAIEYAAQSNVLIVAAAGNEGVELEEFGPGGHPDVITVGATHYDDRAAGFSNYGDAIDIVAPGVDVLSLRARYTDANYRPTMDDSYSIGGNYVGDDKRYLRVSGTSFSAPIVAGTAALILGKDPSLDVKKVRYLLLETADDIEMPGTDQYSGHGLLNARSALATSPDFFVTAEISGAELIENRIVVTGTIDADQFKRAWLQIGAGEEPGTWRYVGQKRKLPIRGGVLGRIPNSNFIGADVWQVVISVEHKNGQIKRFRYPLQMTN